MGQVLLLGIRGKLKNLFDDLDNSASHPEREYFKIVGGKSARPFSYSTST